MTEQQMKETYLLRTLLDADNRCFICDETIKRDYEKRFQVVHPDVKLLQFANDQVGMTSDCFILYAIAHLGCPVKDAIVEFLSVLSAQNPDMHIVVEKELVSERLRYLQKLGLVMRYSYAVNIGKEQKSNNIVMFILTEDGISLVRQHLKKRCTLNAGFYAKHIRDLIGWSSAAYAGAFLANRNNGFVEYSDGILRTKQMGSIFFSCEWKSCVNNMNYYVAFMPSYLEFDKSYMSERDYDAVCANFVNSVRNYINCRTQKGMPCVVIAVQDNADLNNIALNIVASGVMEGMLDNIFFIGEGIINSGRSDHKRAFLRILMDSSQNEGYVICATEAPFIA